MRIKLMEHRRWMEAGRPCGPRIPRYATDEAAGLDLEAAEGGVLLPGERKSIPLGIALDLPYGYEGQIRPRSGLAKKHGIGMVNAPGTIDSDYRGELHALLINHGTEAWHYMPGDRIAQLVIAPVSRVRLEEVDELSETRRGEGGFGSTGIRGEEPPDMGPEVVGMPLERCGCANVYVCDCDFCGWDRKKEGAG